MTSAKMGPAKLANVGGGSTTLGPETKTPPPSPPTTTMATTTTTTNTTVLASSSRPTREDPERLNEDDEGDNDDDDDAGKANLCGHKQEEEEQQHSCASGMERNIAQLATNDAADAADADASESNECHGAPVRRAAATANPSAQANQIKSSESEANTSTTTISDEINNNDDDKDAEQCADNRLSPGTRCATRPQTLGRRHYHHQDEPLAGERLTSELDGEELVLRNSPAGSSGALESQRSTGASREHSSSLCQEGATDSGSSEGDGGEGDPITDWPTSGSKKSDIVVRTSPKAEVLSCKFDRCTTIPVSERREETTTSQEEEEEEDGEQQHQQQDPNEGPSESETVMGKRLGRPASAAAQVPLPSTPTQTGTGTIEFKFQQQQQQQQHSSSNRGPQASTTGAAGPRPKRARTPLGTSRENSIIGNASSPGRQQHPSSATPNSNGHNNNNSDKTVITPTGRPASAMAGGLATTLATVATNSATTRPDAASCAPKSLTPSHTSSQQRPKTTRVRINSTSEQIQDPNWLIEMSREFELQQKQQHSKRMFAFRSLQQRLKSTIVGGGSSSGGSPSKLADVPHDNQQPPPVNATDGRQLGSSSAGHQQAMGTNNANMVPPPIPSTPVKIPVSILKQPTNSHQQSQRPSHTANAKSIAQPSTSMACNKPPNASASSGSTSAPLQDVSNSTGASGGRPASRNVASPTNNHHTSSHSSSSLPKNTKRGGGELGETGGVAAKQAPQSGKQSATIKTSQVTKSALAIASQGDLDQCQSHKQQPQQQQQSTQSSSASQRQAKQTSQTAPSPQAPSSAQIQPAANQHHSPTGATSTGQQQSQQQPQPQQQYRTTTVRPICADGQVKVSGWKRNNLLAKTLSHFDEIRGNQRPIFMPTKITLPSTESPESCGAPQASLGAAASQLVVGSPSSGAHGGADGSLGMRNPSLLSSPSAARANKFADIVREALLKKSLLVSGTGNHQPAAASNSVVVISHRVSDTPDAASSSQHQQQYQRAKCDSASSEMGPPNANHSAKRSVSAEPGRPSVSSLGRDSIAGSSSTTGGAGNQSRRSRQLLLDSGESSSSQQQQQQLQNQQTHSGGQYGGARSTSSAGSTTSAVSMAQIIAAAVAASSGDHHQQPARTSFSLSSSSSSRAFKLQLKNEQVLQNLRRQSNEHHRDSLVAHLAGGGVGVTSSSVTSSAAAATHLDPELGPSSVAGGNGPQSGSMLGSSNRSSVRLRDWKRLTTKLGLLTGRAGERQAFAGAVRSAAGTPPHPYGQPLRLTVSNQEANSRNTRRVRRGSNEQQNSGGSLVPSHCSGGRLLVPGGSSSGGGGAGGGGGLFDAPNRRHSSQTCVSAEPTGGERKLSSSSMVVQSFTDSNASKLDSAATAAGAGHRQRLTGLGVPVVGGGRGRMSRSAAASPMLQAHQDSMCLRRSSDSEACERIRGKGKLVLSGSRCGASPAEEDVDPLLSSSLAGAPADLGTGRRRQCSSTGSSVSSETGTTRQLRATASDSSAVTSQNNPKTTPVVVKRDDLIHLQQVANLSGVSLAVSQASGGDECSCCDPQHVAATSSKSDSSACSCGCHHQHTPTKKPINAGETLDTTANSQQAVEIALPNLVDKIDDSAGGGGGGSVTQLGGGIAEPSGDEQRPDPTAAIETETTPTKQKGPRKNDLSWVVKRTSKVAYFQQKLRKIRWHSKQQQQPDEAANQGDERQQQQRLHAGQFEGDPAEAPIDRDDNLMTNEDQQLARPAKKGTPRRRKSKNGTQDCKELEAKDELVGDDERSAVSGKQVASDIFMDPTLIGDAIEIFLRTTMQQQQQQQQEEEQQRKHKLLGNDETKSAFGPLQEGGAHEVRGPDDGDKRAPTLRTLRAQVLSEPADEQEGS